METSWYSCDEPMLACDNGTADAEDLGGSEDYYEKDVLQQHISEEDVLLLRQLGFPVKLEDRTPPAAAAHCRYCGFRNN